MCSSKRVKEQHGNRPRSNSGRDASLTQVTETSGASVGQGRVGQEGKRKERARETSHPIRTRVTDQRKERQSIPSATENPRHSQGFPSGGKPLTD
ncbi:hypothetical protein E2C01_038542 [Portunus trituberculatus]|uniref:Uncharacterized protein n=1 Tax=Portunus trituberculatus TaxID=210409 RepID=A0A5B7FCH5_PORTR|nr:hypothetical protein [Portunus trituberculatus]